jgi:vacuolar-type H+-ATPase subunit C/Vma6
MYIVREIFHLQFGKYKEAKALVDEAISKEILKFSAGARILTDFTGPGYRLIFESSYATLADFETDLAKELNAELWKTWYEKFKPLVQSSEREILKEITRIN